ncbi:hypothetical protein R9X47_20045 [Wukongibacter baidiensis]
MGNKSDTTTKDNNKVIKEKLESVNIEEMAIFSSYKILADGTRIFSAED